MRKLEPQDDTNRVLTEAEVRAKRRNRAMDELKAEAFELIQQGQDPKRIIEQIGRHPYASLLYRDDLRDVKQWLQHQAEKLSRSTAYAHIIGRGGSSMCGVECNNTYDIAVQDVTKPVTTSARQFQHRKRKRLEGHEICTWCWKAVLDEVEAAWQRTL